MALMFLIGSIFVYASMIRPALDEIDGLRGKLASRADVLENYGQAVKQLQNLLAQHQETTDVQQQVSLALPIGQNVPQAINQVIGIASANNLTVQSMGLQQLAIKPATAPLVRGVGTLRMNARVAGNYQNFKSFLKNLETNITLLDITSLKIEVQKEKTGALFLAYTMAIDTYYQTQ
jgi:Tfp pilus assembly protein PilO